MWIAFAFAALAAGIAGLGLTAKEKDGRLFLFLSLLFAGLTFCALYQQNARWALRGDLAALEDAAPTLSRLCWGFAALIAALNLPAALKKL